jgi:hypothetical protein
LLSVAIAMPCALLVEGKAVALSMMSAVVVVAAAAGVPAGVTVDAVVSGHGGPYCCSDTVVYSFLLFFVLPSGN